MPTITTQIRNELFMRAVELDCTLNKISWEIVKFNLRTIVIILFIARILLVDVFSSAY